METAGCSHGRELHSAVFLRPFSVSSYVLKFTANLGKLKKHIEVSKALHSIGLLSAVPVPTTNGAEFIQDGDVYFYLTRRLPGEQMVAPRFAAGDGRL